MSKTSQTTKKVKIAVGETTPVRLGSNPSTGYNWEVDPSSLGNVVALVGKPAYTPDPAPEGIVGSGGTMTFVLLAKKPCTQHVNFIYLRPWNHEVAQRTTVEVVVH